MVERVIATQRARALIERLRQEQGALRLRHGGDGLDGGPAEVFGLGRVEAGASDLLLGEVAGCPLYVGREQAGYWKYVQLIVDVAEGEDDSPCATDTGAHGRLRARSRRLSTEEWAALSPDAWA